jgi:hypothetical protein
MAEVVSEGIGRFVPGSKHFICAWLKTLHLCLAQNNSFVPGSKHFICAWLKTVRTMYDKKQKNRQYPDGHCRLSDFY